MGFSKTYKLGKDFFLKSDHFELSDEYKKKNWKNFLKLTGSRFSSLVEENIFSTPAKLWLQIVKLYSEKIEPIYKTAGNVLEPKVRDYVSKKIGQEYKVYDGATEGYDVFRDIDPILGGIPDGEPLNENGRIDYSNGQRMLEIKTTSIDGFKWAKDEKGNSVVVKDANGVPVVKTQGAKEKEWYKDGKFDVLSSYKLQLSLYLFLRGQTKGKFAVCFLKPEDYAQPENVDVSQRKVEIMDFDLDTKEFSKLTKFAKEWYVKYVVGGISPKFTPADIKWLKEEGIL